MSTDFSTRTLSDFMDMEVCRTGNVAEIIFDHSLHEGQVKPIRLIGFEADAELSDYLIREAGFAHYKQLITLLS